MVKAEEILSMEFLKKTEFTGSSDGMRYRLEKKEVKYTGEDGEEKTEKKLLCTIWPEPFNYNSTPEEKKTRNEFTFNRDGVLDAVSWMNDQLFERHEEFEKAPDNWDTYKLT